MMLLSALVMLQTVTPAQIQNVQRLAPAVRASLEAQMIDYPSARFRNVYVTRNTSAEAETGEAGDGYLCGLVNSKNRMGGYSGWQRFIAIEGAVMLPGDSMNDIIIEGSCVRNAATDGVDRSAWIVHR